jgi:IS5 family transposase
MHIGVDQGSGIIRSRMLTPAKVYEKRSRRADLKARGIKDRIQHRRTNVQPALPHWQSVRNKLIGRIRTAVERRFSTLKCGGYGLTRMRYRGLSRCSAHLDIAIIAYNLRRITA